MVDEAVRDAGLLRDVGDPAAVVPLLGEDLHRRVEDGAALLRLGLHDADAAGGPALVGLARHARTSFRCLVTSSSGQAVNSTGGAGGGR
jgi:hypothetical protein